MNGMLREQRIRNNRLRRQRERRKNILLFVITVCFVCTLFFSIGSILSNAKDNHANEYKYYTSIPVREGDTLWTIAKEHMDSHYDSVESYISELKQINSLSSSQIQAGRYLVIPYYSSDLH